MDHDISQMISHHVGHGLAELYLVSFPTSNANIEYDNTEDDEEYERTIVYCKDDFWDEVLSVDTDDNDSCKEELVESKRVGVLGVVKDDRDGDEDDVGEDYRHGDRDDYGGEDGGNSEDLYPSDILILPVQVIVRLKKF
jgi:hypothetical protein